MGITAINNPFITHCNIMRSQALLITINAINRNIAENYGRHAPSSENSCRICLIAGNRGREIPA